MSFFVGRGGAGNITAKEAVESQSENTIQSGPQVTPEILDEQRRQRTQYITGGRGGAGNVVHADIARVDDAQYATAERKKYIQAMEFQVGTAKSGWSGRGGFGNYIQDIEEARRREAEESRRLTEEKIKAESEHLVETGLSAPLRAYTGK